MIMIDRGIEDCLRRRRDEDPVMAYQNQNIFDVHLLYRARAVTPPVGKRE